MSSTIEERIKYLEDVSKFKMSKGKIEETAFTLKGNWAFQGTNSFSTAPTIDGQTIKTTESSLTETISTASQVSGIKFTQVGSDMVGEDSGDRFGSNVSMSSDGTRIAVGAPNDEAGGSNAGSVKVYEYSSGSWNQLGSRIDGTEISQFIGGIINMELSGDGTTLIIGFKNSGTGGLAKVYRYSDSEWNQLGSDITVSDENIFFGTDVSISNDGSIVSVGSDRYSENKGLIRVYQYSDSSWTQMGDDFVGTSNDCKLYLSSLSSDGLTIAMSEPYTNENADGGGKCYVYTYADSTWTLKGRPIFGAASEYLGVSTKISSDGSTVALGSSFGSGTGLMKVYRYIDSAWTQLGSTLTDGGSNSYGYDVEISSDGKKLLVGTFKSSGIGKAYLYQYTSDGWSLIDSGMSGTSGQAFGASVGMSSDGTRIVVGAPYYSSYTGKVQAYDLKEFAVLPTSAPLNPAAGTMYFASNVLYVYNGSAWVTTTLSA